MTVNGEEFLYQLYPEPRCGKIDPYTDCEGYEYRGASDGYIYYGEDDDQVVEWRRLHPLRQGPGALRVCAHRRRRRRVVGGHEDGRRRTGPTRPLVSILGSFWASAVGFGRYMNNSAHPDVSGDRYSRHIPGRGITCPDTGGCARVNKNFRANTGFTLGGTIALADPYIGLHEIGHMVGLSHGPDNRSFCRMRAISGQIWPRIQPALLRRPEHRHHGIRSEVIRAQQQHAGLPRRLACRRQDATRTLRTTSTASGTTSA